MENSTIAILMATYNGEKFLKEQIESILAQTNQNWHLYIHDDGSKDNTMSIIKSYTNEFSDKITLLDYPSQGGACQNFLSLLERIEASYYMFCDQDDVWLPEKIELARKEMERQERDFPDKAIVICSDLFVVDEKLAVIHDSMWRYHRIFPQYIKTFNDSAANPVATGCTMIFNHKAKESNSPYTADVMMHDCWICLCALKQKGILVGINQQLVYYRQHGKNSLGIGVKASDIGFLYRIKHFMRIYRFNRDYYKMLSILDYGSVFKFVRYKFKYRQRIKRGYY